MPTSKEVRQQFLDFFFERGHVYAPPVPLPAVGDPTLLFVNSGMAQFKDIFLGNQAPQHLRVCNSQKCLRVSGKHNDLEDVGRDGVHLTFFEMLGYWSFGDYFKADAIRWIWELFTDVWGVPKERLFATCFAGDPGDDVPRDDEAAELWVSETDIDPSHIQFWAKKDNFWEMGDTGPCGPCSEIHIDLTPDASGGALVNADDPQVVELGNDVFIQYNRDSSGKLTPLPRKHVDFGGGFDRILAVLNGKDSVYDTDLFTPIFERVRELSGSRAYTGAWDDAVDVAYRVIGDHIRCLTFAMTDGVLPSNDGAGYVLRRILRRAARHGRQAFGADEPFLHSLVEVVVDIMGDAFPELTANPQHVAGVIREEEESFGRTLGRGIELFEQAASRSREEISGEDAFKLHDTYGFPLDLTQVMASERGMTVDTAGFAQLMERARRTARAAAGGTAVVVSLNDVVHAKAPPPTEFVGYGATTGEASETAVLCRLVDGVRYEAVETASAGDEVALAFARTPFYAEAGGQVGDTGVITGPDGLRVVVTDTQRIGGVHFHIGTIESGEARSGPFHLEVDAERRARILPNHTGTHMMNLALRHVLGSHVDQKGSLVDDEKLRFDLSHHAPVTTEELERIEDEVNRDIARNLPVYDEVIPLADAMRIRNLRAVFGEKYPHEVRVVAIGVPVAELVAEPDKPDWDAYSIELCGGTHLASSAEAVAFVFTHEEAVAKGVRRVFALTGSAAREARSRGDALWARFSSLEGAGDLASEVASLTAELQQTLPAVLKARVRDGLAQFQKTLRDREKARGRETAGVLVDEILGLGNGDCIVGRVSEADPGALRAAVEQARGRISDAAILVASTSGDAVSVVAAVPKTLVERGLKAGDWVRETVAAAGGKGGGKPEFAQGGFRDPSAVDAALEAARRMAEAALS